MAELYILCSCTVVLTEVTCKGKQIQWNTEVKVLLQPHRDEQKQHLARMVRWNTNNFCSGARSPQFAAAFGEMALTPAQLQPPGSCFKTCWKFWDFIFILLLPKLPPKLLENRECLSGSCSLFNQGQRHLLVVYLNIALFGLFLASWQTFRLLASEKLAFYCVSLQHGSEPNFLSLPQLGVSLVGVLLASAGVSCEAGSGSCRWTGKFSECAFLDKPQESTLRLFLEQSVLGTEQAMGTLLLWTLSFPCILRMSCSIALWLQRVPVPWGQV